MMLESIEVGTAIVAGPADPPVKLPELPDYDVLDVIGRARDGSRFTGATSKATEARRDQGHLSGSVGGAVSSRGKVDLTDQLSARRGSARFSPLPDGRLALIMEYVSGSDLRELMRSTGGVIPAERAVKWMADVCDGMNAASEQGIIHRDLKPANILIDTKNGALVADFGLARSEETLSGMTLSDSVMGTPHYMAPEQAEDPPESTPVPTFTASGPPFITS